MENNRSSKVQTKTRLIAINYGNSEINGIKSLIIIILNDYLDIVSWWLPRFNLRKFPHLINMIMVVEVLSRHKEFEP